MMSSKSPDMYHIGVVCALPKEMAAARAMLDQEHDSIRSKDGQDSNCYALGEVHGHNVVIACLPAGEYGTNAAATVAINMLRTFTKLRFGLMVGIGGGVPQVCGKECIRLGDVVVSQPDGTHGGVVQYDLGKNKGQNRFERKGFLNRPPTVLLTALSSLQSKLGLAQRHVQENVALIGNHPDLAGAGYAFPGTDRDHLYCASCDWSPWQIWWWVLLLCYWIAPFWSCRNCDRGRISRSPDRLSPRVYFGTIASGNSLIKNAAYRDQLRDELGAKCVEMEAAGLMNNFPCLVIRGICDYADTHKNDLWQEYAAATAAAFAKEFLSIISPTAVDTSVDAITIMSRTNELLQESVQLQNEALKVHQEQNQKSEVRERTQHERDCLQVFKTSPYERNKDINKKRVANTCRWVLDHEYFQKWSDSSSGDLLWISADPGCGKSVLSKFLIDDQLAAVPRSTVCYYFFKDNEQQDKLAPALCAILHQLFSIRPHLTSYAIPAWKKNGAKIREEVSIMWEILLDAVGDESAGNFFVILDALDECRDADRQELIGRLCDFHRRSSDKVHHTKLKFLVTSRPYDDVSRWFEEITSQLPRIRLRGENENDSIRKEINLVIDQRIEELAAEFHLSTKHQDKLRQTLYDMEHRTYLWLYLAIDEIRARFRDSLDPEEAEIYTLPKSVEDAYEQILQRVTHQQRPYARRILLIIVGARRPLTIEEVGWAVNAAVAYEKNESIVKAPNVSHLERQIRGWCGLFVFFNHSRLFLIHQTAKEFLLTTLTSYNTEVSRWKSSLLDTQVEWEMAIACITYLIFATTEPLPDMDSDSSNLRTTFFQYCAEHWTKHLQDRNITQHEKLLDNVLKLYDTTNTRFHDWFPLWWKAWGRFNKLPRVNDQHAIAMNGHAVVLAERYNAAMLDCNEPDDSGSYAVTWAASCGSVETVEALVDRGADVNSSGGFYGTALIAASAKCHKRVAALLLDRGADVNASPRFHGTALINASREGHEKMVVLLLDRGAEVNASKVGDVTALMAASQRGHEKVVMLLLDKGADVNARDVGDGTALTTALDRGDRREAKLLIDAGASVHLRGRGYGTALITASREGHEKVVALLLDRSADVNASEVLYGTALMAASQRGHEKVVVLLLDKGADVNAREVGHGTALMTASREGHEKVVILLLDRGADVNASGGVYGTALIAASQRGREKVVELLLARGADVNTNVNGVIYGTALTAASMRGASMGGCKERVVLLLLNAGANINLKDQHNISALYYASRWGYEKVVQILLDAGADINAENGELGHTALQIASAQRRQRVVAILEHRMSLK